MIRPRKPPAEKFETPKRMLGRVDDETWERIQKAAQAAVERGDVESLTQWRLNALLVAANEELENDK